MKYRQIAPKLRFSLLGGDRVSERPRNGQTGAFLDSDEPTMVDVPEEWVDRLLASGAIAEAPKTSSVAKHEKAADNGEKVK